MVKYGTKDITPVRPNVSRCIGTIQGSSFSPDMFQMSSPFTFGIPGVPFEVLYIKCFYIYSVLFAWLFSCHREINFCSPKSRLTKSRSC